MVQNVSNQRISLTAKPEPRFPSTGSPLYDRLTRSIRKNIDPNLANRVENFRIECANRQRIYPNLTIRVDQLRDDPVVRRRDYRIFPQIHISPRTQQRLISQIERREKLMVCATLVLLGAMFSGSLYWCLTKYR